MKKMPKYSVIIPVYNAEKTLPACIESLLRQEYGNAEFILVNDGSTDCSGSLCEKFTAMYPQVKYISKEHGGVSTARNAGLSAAKGRYILFVDSDDTVLEDYFAKLDQLDDGEDVDLLWFSHKRIGKGKEQPYLLVPCAAKSQRDCTYIFSRALYRKTLNPLWNKRYKNQIIQENNLYFPDGISIGEDTVFNLQYAMLCRNCRISDRVLYCFHLENRQSLTRSARKDIEQQLWIQGNALRQVIEAASVDAEIRRLYRQAYHAARLRSVYSTAKRLHLTGTETKIRRQRIRESCNEIRRGFKILPRDVFCWLLYIPVSLGLTAVIDFAGRQLAKRGYARKNTDDKQH